MSAAQDGEANVVECRCVVVEASRDGVQKALRDISFWFDEDPTLVLIGMWNTGFAEPHEFCFQIVTESERDRVAS